MHIVCGVNMELIGPRKHDNKLFEAESTDDTIPLLDNIQKDSTVKPSYGAVMDQNTTKYYSTEENTPDVLP